MEDESVDSDIDTLLRMTTAFSCCLLSEIASVTLRCLCITFKFFARTSSEVLAGSDIDCSTACLGDNKSGFRATVSWLLFVAFFSVFSPFTVSFAMFPSSEMFERKAQAEAIRLDLLLLGRPAVTAAMLAVVDKFLPTPQRSSKQKSYSTLP